MRFAFKRGVHEATIAFLAISPPSRNSISNVGFIPAAKLLSKRSVVVGVATTPISAVLTVLVVFSLASVALSQEKVSDVDHQERVRTDGITVEKVASLRKQAEEATNLDAEAKKKVVETLQQAADELKRAADFETAAAASQTKLDNLPERVAQRKAALENPTSPDYSDLPENSSVADLEAALARRQPTLQEAKTRLAEVGADAITRAERRKQLVSLLSAYDTRKNELEMQLQAAAPADELPAQTLARRALLESRLVALNNEAVASRAELALSDADKAADLPSLRAETARRNVGKIEQEVAEITRRADAARKTEAEEKLQQAERAAESADPQLKAEADINAALAAENQDLSQRIALLGTTLEQSEKQLAELSELTKRTKEKVTRVGLSGAIGLELRKQLRSLPETDEIQRECRQRQDIMRDREYRRLELEDQRRALYDEEQRTDIKGAERQLLADRKAMLETLLRNYDDYFSKLSQLEVVQQQLMQDTLNYLTYISERVLWIRSNRVLGPDDVIETFSSIGWFFTSEGLSFAAERAEEISRIAVDDAWEYPLLTTVAVAALIILLVGQQRYRRRLKEIGGDARRKSFCEFRPTLQAALLTVVISLPVPAALFYVGWRLHLAGSPGSFSEAVGVSLETVAVAYFVLNLLRQICRPQGLGAAHFGWPESSLRMFRARLRLLMLVGLPLIFIAKARSQIESRSAEPSLERICVIGALILLSVFLFRLLHPKFGIFREHLAYHARGLANRTRWLWYSASFLVPLSLALLAGWGYFYTALDLSWRTCAVLLALMGVFFSRALLMRWFVVNHRRLRIEQARERRAAMVEKAEAEQAGTSEVPVVLPEEADLEALGEQARRLINTGVLLAGTIAIWLFWADVLPAVRILDRWTLWSTTTEVTVERTLPDGTQQLQPETQVVAITPVNLLFAVFLAVLTITLSRNVPGLMEIILLQRLPLEPSLRYAIRSVTRYVIVIVGVIATFSALGVGWSKLQWLVAALTVGLGFGLQEIFANFISGLIILFERPLRIGDIVTIDNVTGTVSRIQIRATTITDWDRKEFIVPNKEFVTGRMLNWTLSDTTNRIVINVGVAYDADTTLARTLLLKVARENSKILDEPAPLASFEGFGDSALNLVLRCYLPSLEDRLQTITDLHTAIAREFRAAGIEIPYPQRDLHVRTAVPQFFARKSDENNVDATGNGGDRRKR